jgi:hypothetical protein
VKEFHARVGLRPPNWDRPSWEYFAKISVPPADLAGFTAAWRDGPSPKGQRRHYEEDESLPTLGGLPGPRGTPKEVAAWMRAESPKALCFLTEAGPPGAPGGLGGRLETTAEAVIWVSRKTNHLHLWAYEVVVGADRKGPKGPGAEAGAVSYEHSAAVPK